MCWLLTYCTERIGKLLLGIIEILSMLKKCKKWIRNANTFCKNNIRWCEWNKYRRENILSNSLDVLYNLIGSNNFMQKYIEIFAATLYLLVFHKILSTGCGCRFIFILFYSYIPLFFCWRPEKLAWLLLVLMLLTHVVKQC